MIFREEFLVKIKKGKVKTAFRKWNKLSVKKDSTLKTKVGILKFTGIKVVDEKKLTKKHATAAGFDSLEKLLKELNSREGKTVYQIYFKLEGPDPRLKLRVKDKLSSVEKEEVLEKLKRLDSYSKNGVWTKKMLLVIKSHPGKGSKILAEKIKMDAPKLKLQVRKLKNLGLTISWVQVINFLPEGLLF